jgi:hypothetical protein
VITKCVEDGGDIKKLIQFYQTLWCIINDMLVLRTQKVLVWLN